MPRLLLTSCLTVPTVVAGVFLCAATLAAPHDHEGHAHEGQESPDEHGDEHHDEVKLLPEAVAANGVRVETLGPPRPLPVTLSAAARLAYDAEAVAHVGAAVGGRVTRFAVRVGDTVKAGDALATLDSPELGQAQSEYLQRRTAAEAAGPAAELAQSAYDRAKSLQQQTGGVTLTELQSRQRELQTARAEERNARVAAQAAADRLRVLGMTKDAVAELVRRGEVEPTYTLRTPIAGRVIERNATLGEPVGPEKERVLMVADLAKVWAVADVPEARLADVREGAAATVVPAALGGRAFAGTVTHVAAEIDAATRTARVRIELANPDGLLRPGMFVRAELAVAAAGAATLNVPDAAVQRVEGGPAVFVPVPGEAGTFAKRAVRVGPSAGGYTAVLDGLKEGEAYVAGGAFVLKAELGKAGASHEH